MNIEAKVHVNADGDATIEQMVISDDQQSVYLTDEHLNIMDSGGLTTGIDLNVEKAEELIAMLNKWIDYKTNNFLVVVR